MMGRQDRDQGQLFYEFNLDDVVPKDHLLRRMNGFVTVVLAELHDQLSPFYSDIGRPSVDPELMIRMLIVGYCYGIRWHRGLSGAQCLPNRFGRPADALADHVGAALGERRRVDVGRHVVITMDASGNGALAAQRAKVAGQAVGR